MKKIILIFSVFILVSGGIFAQSIKASPLEGRWVWDERGDNEPDYWEIIFFGDVMVGTDSEKEFYDGLSFAYNNRSITFIEDDFTWGYRLAGSTLLITDDIGKQYKYTKAMSQTSPLQGIWKIAGEDEGYFLFVGNVLVYSDDYTLFEGFTISHKSNNTFTINDIDEEYTLKYTLRGNSLVIWDDEERFEMRRIY
jgi:hypothetical protein